MPNGDTHSLASLFGLAKEALSKPLIAAVILLGGAVANYYLVVGRVQQNSQTIQQVQQDVNEQKKSSMSKDDYIRANQEMRSDINRIGDKIDRVNSRIDLILEHESERRAGR